jgi:hypothetical protein
MKSCEVLQHLLRRQWDSLGRKITAKTISLMDTDRDAHVQMVAQEWLTIGAVGNLCLGTALTVAEQAMHHEID